MKKEDLINNLLQSAVFVSTDKFTGSGFIISENGNILTCYHVVEGASKITVQLNCNKKNVEAEIIKNIPEYDIALLKVSCSNKLPRLEIADSEAKIGEEVLYFGYPLTSLIGFPMLHASKGIVSNNIGISNQEYNTIVSTYVVDSVNSEGFSGGPLCCLDTGKVFGIVSSRFDPIQAAIKKKIEEIGNKGIILSSNLAMGMLTIDTIEGIKVAGLPLADRTNITFAINITRIKEIIS